MSFLKNLFGAKTQAAALPDYGALAVDFHSHLIPGIDDGAQTMEESVALVKEMKALGFRHIITTPHVMSDFYRNTTDGILRGRDEVRAALLAEGIDIPFDAAAEYFMDDYFLDLVKKGDLLKVHGDYVLVEMSFHFAPSGLKEYLFRMQAKGYKPILAHPERYLYYKGKIEEYQSLKEAGCTFQVNLMSLVGHYGKPVLDNAKDLIKHGLVDFFASDLHKIQHISRLAEALGSAELLKGLGACHIRNAQFLA